MTVRAVATSLMVRAMGPMASWVYEIGMMPARVIRPRVGRMLKRLVAEAGLRRELTVSVPVAKTAKEAATAAAEPPELPPGVRVWSYGLIVCPPNEETDIPSNASSCRLALPSTIAPARLKATTAGASIDG